MWNSKGQGLFPSHGMHVLFASGQTGRRREVSLGQMDVSFSVVMDISGAIYDFVELLLPIGIAYSFVVSTCLLN